MASASEELKTEMLELNLAYQERFGHVFLICATGATGEQMRDAVKSRIGNSPEQEREIVRTELGKINRIRLTVSYGRPSQRKLPHRTLEQGGDGLEYRHDRIGVHAHPGHQHRPPGRVRHRLARRPQRRRRAVRDARSLRDRCGRALQDLPALPEGTTHVRLEFDTETYFSKKQAEAQQDAPA